MTKGAARAWKAKFANILDAAKEDRAPRIVLWGPASSDPKGYKKRRKVTRAIQAESPLAAVLYPEDPVAIAITREYTDSIDLQEILQARSADLVFALDISPGVTAEVARYSLDKAIASRLIIIAPESRRDSYAHIVMRPLKVHFVRDSELEVCSTASDLCKKEVRGWLIAKLLEKELAYA